MPGFNYDYTRTMMMKLFLARPAEHGSEVLVSFSQALNVIKRVDAITCGIPKIIYLVGWQNRGHDDRYPDVFEVNEALKRDGDASAYDSLMWLISEARRFHTVVSLHINFADAYEDAEMFPLLLRENALIRGEDGKPFPPESYNGKPCYKISYKEYWESGLFKKYFEAFLDFLPVIREQKTIHVDNFQCYFNNNPDIHVSEMQAYRNKMIDLVASCGLDITSEGVYRECEAGKDNFNCKVPRDVQLKSPIATLDRIPALWWLSPYGDDDFLSIPPARLTGGIPGDEYYEVFYGSPHGEDVWLLYGCGDGEWEQAFIDKFARELVPYRYLCERRCIELETTADGKKIAYFDDATVSDGRTATVISGNRVLKIGSDVSMPAVFFKNTLLFYSRAGGVLSADAGAGFTQAELFKLTAEGSKNVGSAEIKDGVLKVSINPGECIIAKPK